jgi:hypothetical protein
MGCNCNKRQTTTTADPSLPTISLETAEWGPVYWRILHGLVEITGNKKTTILDMYEEYKWNDVLNTLPSILPCAECRAHCDKYIAANRPEPIIRKSNADRRNGLRVWFYNLHLGTPKINTVTSPAIEDLPILYKDVHFRADFKRMFTYIDEGVRRGIIEPAKSYHFKRQLDDLMILLDVARDAA